MRSIRLLILVVGLSLLSACSVVSPPPLVARHVTSRPGPVGYTEISLAGGIAGGLWTDGSIGGMAQVRHQAAPDLAFGLDLGGGLRRDDDTCSASIAGCDDNPPNWLASGRVYALYNPDQVDWARIIMGVGGGALSTGARYITADLGAVFSYRLWNFLTPYAGPVIAISLPLYRGEAIDNGLEPSTSGWYGANMGLGFRLRRNLRFTLEWTGLLGTTVESSEESYMTSITGGLQYRF